MTAFSDYVNLELPRRIVLLTEGNTGYTGDPNLAVHAALNGAPQGTQFIDNTAPDYRVYTKQQQFVATSWVLIGAGAGAVTVGPRDVYISSSGDDGDDGLTGGTPVESWARVWEVAEGAYPAVVHVSGTVTAVYEPPPSSFTWVILTGDEDFVVVATGTSTVNSTAFLIYLDTPTTENAFQHFTVEYTDGPYAGYKRTIRLNTTDYLELSQPFPNAVAVQPYRIIRPANKITLARESLDAPRAAFATDIHSTRIDLVNLAVLNNLPVLIEMPVFCMLFGTEFASTGVYITDPVGSALVAGVDAFTFTESALALREAIGLPGIIPGQWQGWGVTFTQPACGLKQEPGGGVFKGYITAEDVLMDNAFLAGGWAVNLTQKTGSGILSNPGFAAGR